VVRGVRIVNVTLTLATIQGGSEMYVASTLECQPTTLCPGASSRTCSWCERFQYFRRIQLKSWRLLVENTSRIGLRVTGTISCPSRGMVVVGSSTSKASFLRRLRRPSHLCWQTYLQHSRGVLESVRNIFLRMAGDSAMVAWKRLETFWWTKRSLIGRWTRMFSRSSVV
jgi:hypothetical protein